MCCCDCDSAVGEVLGFIVVAGIVIWILSMIPAWVYAAAGVLVAAAAVNGSR